MKDLSERIAKSQTDREAWLGKNKIYRTHATSAQEQVCAMSWTTLSEKECETFPCPLEPQFTDLLLQNKT